MLASERYEKIVAITNQRGFVSTKNLSILFDVSETTIRRDCEDLEKQGLIIRVHGGAKSIHQKMILTKSDETKMTDRFDINTIDKDLVAKKAASFINDGDCIFLDGGSSILFMLKYIRDKQLKIVTNNTMIASQTINEKSELFFVGGSHIPEYNMLVGPIALNNLEMFNFDQVFISCAGVDIFRKVVYTAEMDTMAVKEKAMSLSQKKYLLFDHSKMDVKGFCSFIGTDSFDGLICDKNHSLMDEQLPDNFIIAE